MGTNKELKRAKTLAIVAVVLVVLSIFSVIASFVYVGISSYSYYESQYELCRDTWLSLINLRDCYSSYSYMYDYYDELASDSLSAMNRWRDEMALIEIVSGAIIVIGIVLLVIAVILFIVSAVTKSKGKKLLEAQKRSAFMPAPGAIPYKPMAPNGYAVPVQPGVAPVYAQPQYRPVAPNMAPPVAPNMAPPVAPNMAPPVAPNMAPPVTPNMAPPMTPNMAPPVAPSVVPPVAPVVEPAKTEDAVISDNEIDEATVTAFNE